MPGYRDSNLPLNIDLLSNKEIRRIKQAYRNFNVNPPIDPTNRQYYSRFADPFRIELDFMENMYLFEDAAGALVSLNVLEESPGVIRPEVLKLAGDFDTLYTFLTDYSDAISGEAAIGLQQAVLQRLEALEVPPIVVQLGRTSKKYAGAGLPTSSEALAVAAGRVAKVLRKPPVRLSNGTWGFASRKDLDEIKITDRDDSYFGLKREIYSSWIESGRKSVNDFTTLSSVRGAEARQRREQSKLETNYRGGNSEYDIAWMILEFGTGQYAYPRRRRGGVTKAGLPKGRWYFNPRTGGPVIWGQKPTGFLFGGRQRAKQQRQDLEYAAEYLAIKIEEALEKIFDSEDTNISELIGETSRFT